jgi:outer membrane lipoprotein SlyB
MKIQTFGRLALAMSLAVTVGACASSQMRSDTVSRNDVGAMQRSWSGQVLGYSNVTIGGKKSGAGATVGAVSGGAIGAQFGGGTDDKILAGVAGAIAGALIGDAVEESATKQPGYQYEIRLDNGEIVYIVQPADHPAYARGTRVDLVEGRNGRVRIVPRY